MSDFIERISGLSPKRLALLALELKERLDAAESREKEPIAVVGMGCRFPGASSADEFAALLDQGVDAISEVPRDRWDIDAYFDVDPDVPGTMNTRFGGFVHDIDQFDAAHFGISPREANGMDPQQRLFLEVAWEALEHAGIAPDSLAGTQTGVFLGMATIDYVSQVMQGGDGTLDLYSSSGGSHAVASGRLSYILGLHGPAISVDTACSSSLVAAHLACQSLRVGECETAIVGGVNVICAPETTLMLSRARMMAPDGRCKTFDSRADGFVRGEGCGVLVLKRLSVAQAHGDRVLALIRGSAANQDGRSSGLTAPNGPAQEAVIKAALVNAGINASDVSYVEAHGTGTSLGDPIELQALGATYGAGRDARAAVIASSVKTNFGHLEAAAGVAGLAKVILALQRERIPAHLHVITPTPHVNWDTLGVRLPAPGGEAWPRGATPRLAAVSSFGFSGTNAHMILEEAPAGTVDVTPVQARSQYVLPVSARAAGAVRELADKYATCLGTAPSSSFGDVCDTAAVGRAQLTGSRAVVLAPDAAAASAALRRIAIAEGAPGSEQVGTATVHAADAVANDAADVAFMFTGQGGASPGMGRGLFADAPVFRRAMTRLDGVLRDIIGVSMIDVLYGEAAEEFARPEVSSTALVAFQIALAELWRSWGVEPAFVAGHSLGEYAAAVTAGVLGEADALRMVAARGRAVGALDIGHGAMAIIDASQAQVESIIGTAVGYPSPLEIAASNAPEQIVLSGPVIDIERAERALGEHAIRVRRLGAVQHAYHSAQLDPVLPAYLQLAESVTHLPASIEWVSCLTGDVQPSGNAVPPRYWIDQMRQPVQWRTVVDTLARRGARVLIEVGPTAVLSGLSRASLEAAGVTTAITAPSLRANVDDWVTMLDALGRGWVRGMSVDWSQLRQGRGERLALPTYPFQRQRHWFARGTSRTRTRTRIAARDTALLGDRLAGPVAAFAVPTDAAAPGTLRQHVVRGRALFAGSAFIDVALAAASRTLGSTSIDLRDLRFLLPLEVGTGDREACVSVEERDDGEASVMLSSTATGIDADGAWTRHTRARAVRVGLRPPAPAAIAPAQLTDELESLPLDVMYETFNGRGITLGDSVRTIREIWRRDGEAVARLAVAPSLAAGEHRAALLDGALQVLGVASPQFSVSAESGPARMLARIGSVTVHGDLSRVEWVQASITPSADGTPWSGSMRLLDSDGEPLATFDELVLVLPASTAGDEPDSLVYRLAWEHAPIGRPAPLPTLAEVAVTRLGELAAETEFANDDIVTPVLEAASSAYARAALDALGLGDAGPTLSDDALREVLPQHWRLARRMASLVAADAGTIMLPDAAAFARARSLGSGEMDLLERCGPRLAAVMRGAEDPLQLLFPGGSFDGLDRLYRDSAFARTYNGALRDVLASEIAARGATPLRVLEIGAGTGGTTAFVLNQLPAGSRYVFTDLSPLFLERARERFGANGMLECRLLDIERDPRAQGFEAGAFDVIIASNVLHATADLQRTVSHVRELAAPGALVLVLEGTVALRWVDLTFGLTDGWWRFADHALRPAHPLIGQRQWIELLHAAGFAEARATHAPIAAGVEPRQSLLIARAAVLPAEPLPALVFADSGGVGDQLASALGASGAPTVVLHRGAMTTAEVSSQVSAFRARHPGDTRIVYLWGLDVEPGAAPDAATVDHVTLLTEAIPLEIMRSASRGDAAGTRVTIATRGAQCVTDVGSVTSPEQAPLWGWMRGFSLEHPMNAGTCIDLDPSQSATDAAATLIAELALPLVEDQIGVRGGRRHVARLTPRPAPPASALALRADGAYLVTGGSGGIGMRVVEWLARHGAGEVVVVSRSGIDSSTSDSRAATLDAIRKAGCAVHVAQADVSDEASMAALIDRFGAEWKPLRGVLHAAVQMSSAPIAELSPAELQSMRASKVHSARLLDRLTNEAELDFFVLFSSTTSLLGVHGLTHYAAANQYLDALAAYRRAQGRPALAVAWGTWDVMRVASADAQSAIARGGLRQLASDTALDLLGRLISGTESFAVVADVDWSTLVPLYETRRERPLIHALATRRVAAEPMRAASPADAAAPTLMAAVRAARAEARVLLLQQLVRREVATVLGYANDAGIPLDFGFFELGLDSLMSVELKRRLEAAVETSLPATLTFNYPNVAALTGFLDDLLFANTAPPVAADPPPRLAATEARSERDHDSMSDDELENELLARLEKLR